MTKTPEQFCEEISIKNPNIKIIGVYTKAVERIQVKCRICGKEWAPKAYSLLSGKGCPHCGALKGATNNLGKTGLKNREEFIAQLKKKQPKIEIEGEYLNTHTNIACRCLVCGRKWEAKPYSLLQGHGCPRCVKSGTSFMEQLLYVSFCEAFGKKEVVSRDRKIIGMELDIVIPKYKVAIEPGNWLLHKKSIARDTKKREKCKEKGYRLITIYDKFPRDMKPPFETDCYVFHDDLNKIDHSVIRNAIVTMIESLGGNLPIDIDWESLERTAYENSKAKKHEDFVIEIRERMPTIEIIGRYVNSSKRIKVKCIDCGFEWDAVPANLLRGDGCRKCGSIRAHMGYIKSQDEFVAELEKKNPGVEIIGKYSGRHKRIKVRCRICGYEWEPFAASALRGSSHKGAKGIHAKLRA